MYFCQVILLQFQRTAAHTYSCGLGINFAGHLSAVGSLNISITWEPPFTLDITGEDPDITGYCVDVINSTSSVTLHSQCGITETTFTFPIPTDTNCHAYNFSVTPVNIVGNGTEDTTSYIGVQASTYVHLIFMIHKIATILIHSSCDAESFSGLHLCIMLSCNYGEDIIII